jgi:hypothetical protein
LVAVDLSIAIQHTPDNADRRTWVECILKQLAAERPALRVEVVEDRKREGSWPTFLRTLKAASGATHHLMLNDDVSLCKEFVTSVEGVIRARPNNLISLYTNSQWVFTARHRREAWIEKPCIEGAAMLWPRALIAEFIAWQSVHIARDFPWEDVRVAIWLLMTSKRAFATVPSLVQHVGCGKSLLGLNCSSKTATWYLGNSRSGVGIDWTQGRRSPVKDPMPIHPGWRQSVR